MPRGKRGITTDELTEDTLCKFLALAGTCAVVALILFIIYFGGYILILLFLVLLTLIILPFVYKDKEFRKELYFYPFFILMAIGLAALVGLVLVALIPLIILLA